MSVGRIVSRLVTTLPAPLRASLRDTLIQDAYHHLTKHEVALTRIRADTPIGSISLRVPEQSIIASIVRRSGGYEPALTEALCERLDERAVFYDVGARYGYYSTLALACGVPGGSVHCFEVDIRSHYVLNQNHAAETVATNRMRVGAPGEAGATTIDEYASDHPPPSVVKVDVEGAEHDVLRGMTVCLDRYEPELFVEMHPHKLPGHGQSPTGVFELLREAGYTLQVNTNHRDGDSRWGHLGEATLPEDTTYLLHAQPV